MAKSKVFIDSSVLISAVLSSSGGSFYILSRLKGQYEFQINQYVLDEILAVFGKKFPSRSDLKTALFLLLAIAGVKVLPDPPPSHLIKANGLINDKDAPIFVSALENSDFLITLDKDFLDNKVISYAKNNDLLVLKPENFIETILKT